MRAAAFVALLLLVAPPGSVPAQEPASRGPVHEGYDPTVQRRTTDEAFNDPRIRAIEEQLRCNCGCNLDTHSCQYQMQCGTSSAWSLRIQDMMARGDGEEAIKAAFIAEFGSNVLMAPPMEGFNWAGYLMPFVALLAGVGIVMGLLLRRSPATEPAVAEVAGTSLTREEEERLRSAIRALEEEERAEWP